MSEKSESNEAELPTGENEAAIATKIESPKTPKVPPVAPHHLLPPQEEENILRKSLKEINEDMRKMEDLITLTEDIIKKERERDREFYLRERRRKLSESAATPKQLFQVQCLQSLQVRDDKRFRQSENEPTITISSPQHSPESKSPMTFRKKITQRFRRHSSAAKVEMTKPPTQTDQQPSRQRRSPPTFKINRANKHNGRKKMIRFSPRKCKSRLYFRNGRVGCIDAENVGENQTNVEKTHALIKYITNSLDRPDVPIKRSSLTSNISDILSEESTSSLEELPNSNSYFNFECSPAESIERGVNDEDLFLDSLSDIDSFTVPKADDELSYQEAKHVIEVIVKEEVHDEEMAQNLDIPCTADMEPALVRYEDELKESDDKTHKPPDSAMSNHSVGT